MLTFEQAKKQLISYGGNADGFTTEFYRVFLKDRETAHKIYLSGGDVQEFYKNSASENHSFCIQNSGVYCALLEIIHWDAEKSYGKFRVDYYDSPRYGGLVSRQYVKEQDIETAREYARRLEITPYFEVYQVS